MTGDGLELPCTGMSPLGVLPKPPSKWPHSCALHELGSRVVRGAGSGIRPFRRSV